MNYIAHDPFKIYQKIHFIGIGGIGISALARILQSRGHQISGSEQTVSKNSRLLQEEGIEVKYEPQSDNIPEGTQLIIHTTAIPLDNPEMQAAQNRKLPILTYPQAVGWLTKNYKTIAVCGTHGKTTTTAMAALSLIANSADPTVIVGSLLSEFNDQNKRIGQSDIFVLEACEYQESFLNYHPQIVLLNNIDPEHLDYFQNAENYTNVFHKFLSQLNTGSIVIANADDANVRYMMTRQSSIKFITYGSTPDCDYIIKQHEITHKNEAFELNLWLPGTHNIFNATAVIALSDLLGLDRTNSISAIAKFRGANRRFEIKGKVGKTVIIDDYGHAPAEIRATLAGTKEFLHQNAKILCIFQPHQYSRTFLFLDEFASSFADASKVLIPNIYASRDSASDKARVNVDKLVERINSQTENLAENTRDFEQTLSRAQEIYKNYDAIITMGAGDITNLSGELLKLT